MPGTFGRVHNSVHLATITPTTRDLEWAAGFLEGEGCFRFHANTENVSASQINPEPLEKMLTWFGGRVMLKQPKYRSHFWSWSISGSRARGVMMTLYPLLSTIRQNQIEIALAGRKTS